MSKFKVGDKVRRIPKYWNHCGWSNDIANYGCKKEDTFVISEDHICTILIKTIDGKKITCYDADKFELVEDVKFKVGDRVRCTNNSWNYVNYGREYDVRDVDGDDIIVHDNDEMSSNYPMSSFELVSPKEKLIETDMDTVDIKNFPKAVLVAAEKEAKKELAEDQQKIAVTEFKRLFARIEDKKLELSRVQSELKDLRGKAAVAKK